MSESLRVGQVLYGYCRGHFGRDSYDDKRVEAIGADWVIVRSSTGPGLYAGDPDVLLEFTVPMCPVCGEKRPDQAAPCENCGDQ